jgi:nucleoside-diphosphate-sugar epimerase
MEIAVTGGNGRLGGVVIRQLISQGHTIRSLDWKDPQIPFVPGSPVTVHILDLLNLPRLTDSIRGCDAVIHLAAYPGPDGHPPGVVYNNNTMASYNVLYAASELGIKKVCQASSINALGGIGSRIGIFDYFPVDEKHPTYNMDDYSLSKWVMEIEADSFARRFPEMTISSLRFHALPDDTPEPQNSLDTVDKPAARNLWGWTLMSEGARACGLAVEASFKGHEVFFITAPRTNSLIPSTELAQFAYPDVPIRGDLSGRRSFYDCSKAARLLGWVHQDQ